jgi:hypothetical protein
MGAAAQAARAELSEKLKETETYRRYDDGRATAGGCGCAGLGEGAGAFLFCFVLCVCVVGGGLR